MYYGSSGSHGNGGSYGGGYGSHGSGGGVIYESTPVEVDHESHGASIQTHRYGTVVRNDRSSSRTTGAGTLHVSVPADAQVYVNDRLTTSTGNDRTYVSRDLQAGRSYSYVVRVEYEEDGRTVTQTKQASLTADREVSLAFDAPQLGEESVAEQAAPGETELTLSVPADAKVILAGSLTQQSGEERTFSTTRLAPGQSWENYVIRVEIERDGEVLHQERSITLVGGQDHEESFDFDANLLAAK